jgi:hypothetical protein
MLYLGGFMFSIFVEVAAEEFLMAFSNLTTASSLYQGAAQ